MLLVINPTESVSGVFGYSICIAYKHLSFPMIFEVVTNDIGMTIEKLTSAGTTPTDPGRVSSSDFKSSYVLYQLDEYVSFYGSNNQLSPTITVIRTTK